MSDRIDFLSACLKFNMIMRYALFTSEAQNCCVIIMLNMTV